MKQGPYRQALGLLLTALISFPVIASAQFTNSATLSASVQGTNLIISYSLTTTQGWLTLFSADRPEKLATFAQPVDLAQAPTSLLGQFTVPLDPATPLKYYRAFLEQWPSRGKALVFVGGPLNFAAMRAAYGDITNNAQNPFANTNDPGYLPVTNTTPMIFKQPVQVWVDNLGTYDTNGVLVGGTSSGRLQGRYAFTEETSINNAPAGFPIYLGLPFSTNGTFVYDGACGCNVFQYTNVSAFAAAPDFRVNYAGDANVSGRAAVMASSMVQLYYDITEYRKRFLNDAFIDELNLPPEIAANLKQRQFRPDLQEYDNGVLLPPRFGNTVLTAYEDLDPTGLRLYPAANNMTTSVRSRGPYHNFSNLPPVSLAFDSGVCVGDYAGLMGWYMLGANTGFPYDSFYGQSSDWPEKILSPVSNGHSAWAAYRYRGDVEVYRYASYSYRIWDGRPCGGTGVPCDKGQNIRNVMMFDEANLTKDGVFPYSWPTPVTNDDGPVASDLAAMYIGGILYDFSHDVGVGLHNTDLLIWKTLSVVTNASTNCTMRQFGAHMQRAARLLWPDPHPGKSGLSLYENDLLDLLTSRGIPMNGVSDFRTNLPAAIGKYPESLETSSANAFGSAHPESQPSVGFYGVYSLFQNRYTDTNTSAAYVAYQFYKHSKYGPCDKLALTDGTFTTNPNTPFNWSYNSNGTFYAELADRELGNVIVLAPGRSIRWMRSRQRCPNEATGFYAEDVRPFGFRVIKAIPNGFSFTATALVETETNKIYRLNIVDPSTNSLGSATYAWTFVDYIGNTNTMAGSTAQYTAMKDQPFTITIARTRASKTDTLTLRERGNDLDRNNGQAFIRNLVP